MAELPHVALCGEEGLGRTHQHLCCLLMERGSQGARGSWEGPLQGWADSLPGVLPGRERAAGEASWSCSPSPSQAFAATWLLPWPLPAPAGLAQGLAHALPLAQCACVLELLLIPPSQLSDKPPSCPAYGQQNLMGSTCLSWNLSPQEGPGMWRKPGK